GARVDVGGGRAARFPGGADHPADDALPRGGRRARRPARDRLAGQGGRGGDAERAEVTPDRRRGARRTRRRPPGGRAARAGAGRGAGRDDAARRPDADLPRPRRGPGAAGDPRRALERGHPGGIRLGEPAELGRRLPALHGARLRDGGPRPVKAARDTWYMIGRQARNLLREPIWIAILLVQPMVWLLLYGQLFKNVTRLGGFGTDSYITFLAPAIVVMNAFFSASWSGMSMVFDIERKFVERFLATPASRLSIVLSQIVRSAVTAPLPGVVILVGAAPPGGPGPSRVPGSGLVPLGAVLVHAGV